MSDEPNSKVMGMDADIKWTPDVTIKLIPHWRYNLPILGRIFWKYFEWRLTRFMKKHDIDNWDAISTLQEEPDNE